MPFTTLLSAQMQSGKRHIIYVIMRRSTAAWGRPGVCPSVLGQASIHMGGTGTAADPSTSSGRWVGSRRVALRESNPRLPPPSRCRRRRRSSAGVGPGPPGPHLRSGVAAPVPDLQRCVRARVGGRAMTEQAGKVRGGMRARQLPALCRD